MHRRWIPVVALPGAMAVAAAVSIAVGGGQVGGHGTRPCSTDLSVAVTRGWDTPQVLLLEGDQTRVLLPEEVTSDPAFSPDGSEVVLVRAVGGDYESAGPSSTDLWAVHGDGGDPRVVLTGGLAVETPDWSPDGRTIAYSEIVVGATAGDGGVAFEIHAIAADGNGEPMTLVPHDGRRLLAPAWSPDGDRLAFLSDRARVEVVDHDGRNARTLAELPEAQSVTWSPDGRHLLVGTRPAHDAGTLVLVDAHDGSTEVVSDEARMASWASDGSIHHLRWDEDRWTFARSTIEDGRLVHDRDFEGVLDDDGYTIPWATNDAACPR